MSPVTVLFRMTRAPARKAAANYLCNYESELREAAAAAMKALTEIVAQALLDDLLGER